MILGRVILAPPERRELQRRALGGSSYSEICARLGCTDRYISLWKERFQQERLGGLDSRYRGAEYRRRTAQTEARILELTRSQPTDGSTHSIVSEVPLPVDYLAHAQRVDSVLVFSFFKHGRLERRIY